MKKNPTKIFIGISLTALVLFAILLNIFRVSFESVAAEREDLMSRENSCNFQFADGVVYDQSDPLATKIIDYDE